MAVRSKTLGTGLSVNGAFTIIYTCPPGRTAILKDASMTPAAPGVTRAVLSVSSGPNRAFLFDAALGALPGQITGRFAVLMPGDHIELFSTGQPFVAKCWGAELDGVAP